MAKDSLAAIRKEHGLTQEEVARAIGRSVYHVSRIETGAVHAGADSLKALAALYKRPIKELAQLSSLAHGRYLKQRSRNLAEAS